MMPESQNLYKIYIRTVNLKNKSAGVMTDDNTCILYGKSKKEQKNWFYLKNLYDICS